MKKGERSLSLVIINVILLGIIALILTPYILSLVLHITPYFIVSDSMIHVKDQNEPFYKFWQNRGYSAKDIDNFPILDGLNIGDIVFIKKDPTFEPGDVVAYTLTNKVSDSALLKKRITIHRVISLNQVHFSAIGDRYINQETVSTISLFRRLPDGTLILDPDLKLLKAEEKDQLVYLPLIEFKIDNNIPISSYIGKAVLKVSKIGYFYVAVKCIAKEDCFLKDCLLSNRCNLVDNSEEKLR